MCRASSRRLCDDASVVDEDAVADVEEAAALPVAVAAASAARRNCSSNGLTFCRSWNRPTSSQLRMNRVGVGVSSSAMNEYQSFGFSDHLHDLQVVVVTVYEARVNASTHFFYR